MKKNVQRTSRAAVALVAASLLAAPLVGCGDRAEGTVRRDPPPPVDDSRAAPYRPTERPYRPNEQPEREPGHGPMLSTKQKVVILAGAAALYYLYRHHQHAAAAQGPDGQYYLSKNGRVYYRDADHRAHWVTPPAQGIEVPESEAREYERFQGYDNRSTGRDLSDLGTAENP